MSSGAPLVKICGITDNGSLDAVLRAGADMVGFVFFERSPRFVTPPAAAALASRCAGRVDCVALTVDLDDTALDAVVNTLRPDMLQLHGRESPARAAEIKRRYGLPVMRALAIGCLDDLAAAALFEDAADYLLLDAPPPGAAQRPGGHGAPFDWTLLCGFAPRRPWLLAGGLHPKNVASALRETGAQGVDVSSGVERAPGLKDPERILAFVREARAVEENAAAC